MKVETKNSIQLKICAITGLVFLALNQIMLLQGNTFIQNQTPIDYAHWLLLIGVVMTLSLNHIFSDNNFRTTASILTSLGVIALVGQATIDFLWWSYGTDYERMNDLTNQIMGRPSIRIPFITIGPALFYLGLALHAGKYIKQRTLWSLIVISAVVITGLGSFAFDSRNMIVLGHFALTIGITGLVLKKKKIR